MKRYEDDLAQKDKALEEKDKTIEEQGNALDEKDALIKRLMEEIAELKQQK